MSKKDITAEQLEYLKSKGWDIKDEVLELSSGNKTIVTYTHPKLSPEKHGGYSDPKNALETQSEQDAYDLGKCYYYLITDNHGGYGYTIYERTPDGKRRLVFNHHDKKIASEMVEKLRASGKCDQVIFDTSFVYQSVLILKEKHGDHYYYVPNLPCLFKTCRSIVMDRIKEGYWYPTERNLEKLDLPSLTKEEIEKMKDGPVKRAAQDEWKNYEYNLKYQESEKVQIEAIKFIKANDNLLGGKKAYLLLKERNGGEYEGFTIEDMNHVE